MSVRAFGRTLAAAFVLAATVGLLPAAALAGELQVDATSGLHYVEIVTGGAAPDAPLPVVVAIHGLGDNPESFRLLLDDLPARARVVVPRGPMPHGPDGYSWFAFHNDDGGEGSRQQEQGIRESADRVSQLVGSLAKRFGGPSRAVICGFSQGGILSFAVAAAHPGIVAVAIPVAGYLPPALWPAERPKTKPLPKIVALHGDTDWLIPVESARWTVEALRSNGFDTSLKTWPGIGHALVPEIRSTLTASVVSAVESLSPAGTVLEGPPQPVRLPAMRRPAGDDAAMDGEPSSGAAAIVGAPLSGDPLEGFPAAQEPQLDAPSPLEEPSH